MRWEHLFADLEFQFAELAAADERSELADQERHEIGSLTLVERLSGALGGTIRLRLRNGRQPAGELMQVGVDWVLLGDPSKAEVFVPLAAIVQVEGLATISGRGITGVGAKLDLRRALRAVARDRSGVSLALSDGSEVVGTLDRVGADYVELALHAAWESRRAAAVQSVQLVPISGIEMVRAVSVG